MPESCTCGNVDCHDRSASDDLRVGKIPLAVTATVAGILSVGVVLVALLFIWQCFQHPDAANVIIPLITAGVSGLAISEGKSAVRRAIERKKTIETKKLTDANNQPGQ